jgi:hypothetical protein
MNYILNTKIDSYFSVIHGSNILIPREFEFYFEGFDYVKFGVDNTKIYLELQKEKDQFSFPISRRKRSEKFKGLKNSEIMCPNFLRKINFQYNGNVRKFKVIMQKNNSLRLIKQR